MRQSQVNLYLRNPIIVYSNLKNKFITTANSGNPDSLVLVFSDHEGIFLLCPSIDFAPKVEGIL